MKTLILALTFATATMAQAQQTYLSPVLPSPIIPKTIKLHNSVTKEPIGTVTVNGNTVYFRDKHGTHYATMVRNPDGTKTLYDPSGKVIKKDSLNLPEMPQ